MDDNAKILNQTADPIAQAIPVQSQVPTQPVPTQTVQPAQPVQNPTGSANKEMGPTGSSVPQLPELQPAGTEVSHDIGQELKDIGVKEIKEHPELTDDHSKAGIKHSIPPLTVSSNPIQFVMSDEEVEKEIRAGKNNDSGRWLAELIKKVKKVMGI